MPILGIIASSKLTVSNSYESIATVTVGSGGAADVTFSSIPATYTHLQIRGISNNSAAQSTYIRLNGDTASNYSWHVLYGNGSSTFSANSTSSNIMYSMYSSTTASIFGVTVTDILDYKDTNKYTTIRVLTGYDTNGAGDVLLYSGNWRSTSAVTSIVLFPASGNFNQYSQFALYGIKGA